MLLGPAIILSCLILGFGSSPAPNPAADPLDNINLNFPNKDFIKDTPVLVHFDKENIDVPLQELMPEPTDYGYIPPDRDLGSPPKSSHKMRLPDRQRYMDGKKRMPKTKVIRGNSRYHKHDKNKIQGYRHLKRVKNQGDRGPHNRRPHRNPYKSIGSFKKYKNGNHGYKGYPRNQYRPKKSYTHVNKGHKGSPRSVYKPKEPYKDDDNDNHADYIIGGKQATAG